MTTGFVTKHGLQGMMDEVLYQKVFSREDMATDFGAIVEAGEIFPMLCAYATFITLALKGDASILVAAGWGIGAQVLAFLLSRSSGLMAFSPITFIASIFNALTTVKVHWAALAAIGIWVAKSWYVVAFWGASLVLSLIQTGTHKSGMPFNNRAAEIVLRRYGG